jgi:hypothetical protein
VTLLDWDLKIVALVPLPWRARNRIILAPEYRAESARRREQERSKIQRKYTVEMKRI